MEKAQLIFSQRWITAKAKYKTSKINGMGVFAVKPIEKDEVVGVFGGVIITKGERAAYRETVGDVGIQISDDFFMCPTGHDELLHSGVFNHSCNPNIGYSDPITFVALRKIKPGEELLFDYAFSETIDTEFECRCKARNCRKAFHIDDWKKPALQKKYGKYFSPYIQKKFSKRP